MLPNRINHKKPAIQSTAGFLKPCRKPLLRTLFDAASRVRFAKMLQDEARELDHIERLRQEAEAMFDLHDSVERWMRGDDPIYGFPSQQWKALHPQMNYHLQRIRHREQHELWGPSRLPVCKERDRATIAFLNSGGDLEETFYWHGLEEEFLNSLIWQWKNDTGI